MSQAATVFENEQTETNSSVSRNMEPNDSMIPSTLTNTIKSIDAKTGDDEVKKRKKKKKKKHQSSTNSDTHMDPQKSQVRQGSHSTKGTITSTLPDYSDEGSHLWPRDQDEQWESTTKCSDFVSIGGFTDVDVNSTWGRGAGQSVTGESIDNPRRVFTKIDNQNRQRRSRSVMNQQSSIFVSSPSVAADLLLTNDALPSFTAHEKITTFVSSSGETELSNSWKENNIAFAVCEKEHASSCNKYDEEDTIHEIDEASEVSMMENFSFHKTRNKRVCFCLIVGLVILVAAVTGSTIVLLQKQKGSSGSTDSSGFTISPSSSPAMTYDQLYVWAVNASGYSALNEPDSPQMKAVLWMAGFDRAYFESFGVSFLQRYALVVFYFSTGGYTWTDWKMWLDPELHECDWSEGLTCNTDELQRRIVTGLNETDNSLSGSLPVELQLLDELNHLHLADNMIGGPIPVFLGRLNKLVSLDLASNSFHGPIPQSFTGATSLVELRLSKNKLNGSIPSALYEMSTLQTLDLSWNEITGPILDDVSRLQHLVAFDVRHNQLSGSIPLTFDDITTLDYIWLDFNKFSGSIPRLTLAMANRLEMTLSHNQLTGSLPFADSEYRHLQDGEHSAAMRVEKIDVSYNRFTGTVDLTLGLLPAVRYLDFSGNSFTGQFPGDVGWAMIEHLVFGNNYFTGTIPTGWAQSLSHLDFGNNSMSGGIPTGLCKFSRLNFLKLDHNLKLNGSVPLCLFDLSNLKDFNSSATNLYGALPTSIGQLLQLESLDISDNLINGTIPTELGMCTKLTTLDLSNNQLTGVIPSDLGRLEFLQSFFVGNNNLTGLVPEALQSLTNLESLSLIGNELYGSIPQELCSRGEDWGLLDVGCGIECSCCEHNTREQC